MKNIKKFRFFLNWGTYQSETIVYIAYTRKELEKDLKKFKKASKILENLESEEDDLYDSQGFCATEGTRSLVWVKEYKDSWLFWDVFIHEINHAVHDVFKERGMLEEKEAFAYQQEHLIRQARIKIWKYYDKK